MRGLTGHGSDITPLAAGMLPDVLVQVAGSAHLDARTRTRLVSQLGSALTAAGRGAGVAAIGGGRWLTDVVVEMAPHIPVRDLATLTAHHRGLTGSGSQMLW